MRCLRLAVFAVKSPYFYQVSPPKISGECGGHQSFAKRGNRLVKTTIFAAALLVSASSQAINIYGTYIAPGGSIYGATSQAAPTLFGGGNLDAIFNQAANAWNSQIGDDWSLEIQYGWSNSIGSALAQYTGWWFPFGDLRHIQGRILFNPTYSWFADATPEEHSEYQLYEETTKDYGAGAMNVGRKFTQATGAAAGRFDLLTVATHEIGHSLSIGVGPRWTGEVSDGDVDVTSPRFYDGAALPVDNSKAHLADPTAIMWYGTGPGERKLISDLDLEAGMQLSGFAVKPVPEPTGLVVIGAGLAFWARRKRRES